MVKSASKRRPKKRVTPKGLPGLWRLPNLAAPSSLAKKASKRAPRHIPPTQLASFLARKLQNNDGPRLVELDIARQGAFELEVVATIQSGLRELADPGKTLCQILRKAVSGEPFLEGAEVSLTRVGPSTGDTAEVCCNVGGAKNPLERAVAADLAAAVPVERGLRFLEVDAQAGPKDSVLVDLTLQKPPKGPGLNEREGWDRARARLAGQLWELLWAKGWQDAKVDLERPSLQSRNLAQVTVRITP